MTQHTAILTVDIADTVGQSSAIAANRGSIFTIRVTQPVDASGCGFGRVISGGPVNGHEILFKATSVVSEQDLGGLQHRDGLVVFA